MASQSHYGEHSGRGRSTGPKYRLIAPGPNVDESLFGSSSSRRTPSGAGETQRKLVKGPPTNPNTIVLSQSELDRIKATSIVRTADDVERERHDVAEIAKQKQARARERKARMLAMAEESRRISIKSDVEIAEEARNKAILEMAQAKIDDQSDAVKSLKGLAAQAVAFSIRDRQKEAKKSMETAEEDYTKRMDLLMELDRLKDLQRREEEDRSRVERRHRDRSVIISQMAEAQRRRELQQEAVEQENKAMMDLMRRYEEEDAKREALHRVQVERSRSEVLRANEAAIEAKRSAKDRERAEVEAVLRYQALKDAELRKRELEEEELERQKKDRQARLLASQEKSQNRQAELDELRARRAAEEKERNARRREREEADKRRRDLDELNVARRHQEEHKKVAHDRLRQQEEAEATAALIASRKLQEREEREEAQRKTMAEAHRRGIQKQIEDAMERRGLERARINAEGRSQKGDFVAEKARLGAIRDQMVSDLQRQGVDSKYLAEMMHINFDKLLMR